MIETEAPVSTSISKLALLMLTDIKRGFTGVAVILCMEKSSFSSFAMWVSRYPSVVGVAVLLVRVYFCTPGQCVFFPHFRHWSDNQLPCVYLHISSMCFVDQECSACWPQGYHTHSVLQAVVALPHKLQLTLLSDGYGHWNEISVQLLTALGHGASVLWLWDLRSSAM